MAYKVPGVYVEELSLFPPSVAAVATGIPAFIGHTKLTEDADGNSLINKPVRLTSMLAFTTLFGGSYNPESYTIQVDTSASNKIVSVSPKDDKRYYLYNSLRHYFDNGGGPCYVVSVGDYSSDVDYGDETSGLRGGLKALEKVDEPTILVCPDSVALKKSDGSPDFTVCGNLHKAVMDQCARLQDRFGVLDVMEGYQSPGSSPDPIVQFRNEVGTKNLSYGAGYYPWLYTTYLKDVTLSQLEFVDTSTPPVSVPDSTFTTGNATFDNLLTEARKRTDEESKVFGTIGVINLNRTNDDPVSDQFVKLQKQVKPDSTAAVARSAFTKLIKLVRQMVLGFQTLDADTSNSLDLTHLLDSLKTNSDLQDQIKNLIAYEKNSGVMSSINSSRAESNVNSDYTSLDGTDWIGGATVSSIGATSTDFTDSGNNTVAQTATSASNATDLQKAFESISDAFVSIVSDMIFLSDQADKNLFSQHPFFKTVYELVRQDTSLLPPSGAVAGVYASTDRTRGVWKAPANVSLTGVIAPACKLNDTDQSSLNVHDTGKSINAIRAFTGKGVLVWGARTLAGNDNEWRYINVRRFFIFVEESTKKASEPFVFEANDANTWLRVRAMIENFLTIQWRQGALAGATPKEAFYVKIGLGETMTAQDILEGRMIVEIGMAAVRPAEFIILRFSHKMQES